jgi:hypothetical protein
MPGTIASLTQCCADHVYGRTTRQQTWARITIRLNELDDIQFKEFCEYVAKYNPEEGTNV